MNAMDVKTINQLLAEGNIVPANNSIRTVNIELIGFDR